MLLRRRISKCGVLKLHYGILEDGKPEHNLGTEKIRYIDIHLFDCPMISNIEEKILNHLSIVAYENSDIVIHCHQHWQRYRRAVSGVSLAERQKGYHQVACREFNPAMEYCVESVKGFCRWHCTVCDRLCFLDFFSTHCFYFW